MRFVSIIILLIAVPILRTYDQKRSGRPSKPSLDQIETVVRDSFGAKVKVRSDITEPYYLLGDFNGDGFSDLAVLVDIEEARADLKNHLVRYINIDPYSSQNGLQIDPLSHDSHNCLGIAIVHGTAAGWETGNPAGRLMVYECFSSFRLLTRGQRIRRGRGSRGPTPIPKGDSILLDLETGGTALVYWNGKTYLGFGIRSGD
jgi:hypothetical protein